MKVIGSVAEATALVGHELGVSDWVQVDQQRINAFADATGDHQWIHVDVARAESESPYQATIAHGFLTLSLIPWLSEQCYAVQNAQMAINYGLNKVRFIAAVPAGGRIRVRSALVDATTLSDSAVQLTVRHHVELQDSDKPAAVADLIARVVF